MTIWILNGEIATFGWFEYLFLEFYGVYRNTIWIVFHKWKITFSIAICIYMDIEQISNEDPKLDNFAFKNLFDNKKGSNLLQKTNVVHDILSIIARR